MSRKNHTSFRDVEEALLAVEKLWHWRLPPLFKQLYLNELESLLAPCEFFPAGDIASGIGRAYGQFPQFLPFGRVAGEESLYGFYLGQLILEAAPPILYWDEGETFLRPVSCDFDAFLRRTVASGRYESDDDWPADANLDRARVEVIQSKLNLSSELFSESLPRNDTEFHQRLVRLDSQDCVSLCHLGCAARSSGDEERALDYFHRACEAAPWFGDPYYLLADVHRRRENFERALAGYWAVVQRAAPLCTRTWEWDLGEDHPDADIYEIAADELSQFDYAATDEMKSSPLWRVITRNDPYDPDIREQLAVRYEDDGNSSEAERELLSALSFCGGERSNQSDRIYARLLALYERSHRDRDASLIVYDSSLPR